MNPLVWALPLQAALLFWHLDLLDPWGDEWHTLITAPQPLREIASTLAENIHPPLYFFLVHFWIQFPWVGNLLTQMRAMSALWALLATVILYFLWLRREQPRFQRIVLTFWVLSPCLLLYARMARSYTMQLTLALIAIHTAVQWTERPRDRRWFMGYTISCGVLLYTHYLPGLAIMAATSSLLLVRKRVAAAAVSVAVITTLYLPWLVMLRAALRYWTSSEPYQVGNFLSDQVVRLGYWFASFSFGETISNSSMLLAALLTPIMVYALLRAIRSGSQWLGLVVGAVAIGYVGVSRWSGFPFTPSHILFALPFFLILLVKGIEENLQRRSLVLMGIAALYVSGVYDYFNKSGYLNPGYSMPNAEIAAIIHNSSPGTSRLVVIDSTFPQPLVDRLGPATRVIVLDDESADALREPVRDRPAIIWFCRRTRDTSPDGSIARLEMELSQGREIRRYEFLPYNVVQLWIMRWLRGPKQPAYSYELLEMKQRLAQVGI